MLLVEASGQTEVCELDVTSYVKEDVVWLDVAMQ